MCTWRTRRITASRSSRVTGQFLGSGELWGRPRPVLTRHTRGAGRGGLTCTWWTPEPPHPEVHRPGDLCWPVGAPEPVRPVRFCGGDGRGRDRQRVRRGYRNHRIQKFTRPGLCHVGSRRFETGSFVPIWYCRGRRGQRPCGGPRTIASSSRRRGLARSVGCLEEAETGSLVSHLGSSWTGRATSTWRIGITTASRSSRRADLSDKSGGHGPETGSDSHLGVYAVDGSGQRLRGGHV